MRYAADQRAACCNCLSHLRGVSTVRADRAMSATTLARQDHPKKESPREGAPMTKLLSVCTSARVRGSPLVREVYGMECGGVCFRRETKSKGSNGRQPKKEKGGKRRSGDANVQLGALKHTDQAAMHLPPGMDPHAAESGDFEKFSLNPM